MTGPWIAIAIAGISVLPAILQSISVYRKERAGEGDSRSSTSRAWRSAGTQIMLAGLISWAWSDGLITLEGIGLRTDSLPRSFFYGWLGWLVIQMSAVVLQQFQSTEYGVRDYVRTQRMLWPRSSGGRFAQLLVHIINPFTEEVISRGILVLMVHQATGSVVAGVATGLTVCLLAHIYQGTRSLLSHALFFGVTVFLAYSDGGLGAAIVCHLFADLQGVSRRGEFRARVQQERARRRARAVEAANR